MAKFRIPLDWDPSSNMFIAVAAPDGGVGGFPALVQGDPGDTPELDNNINFTALDWDDPTGDFASWTETAPNIYKLNLGLHTGEPGVAGSSLLDPTDYGTPLYKKILIVNAATTGFEYQTQKVGDRYIPASINNTPSGNSGFTLCPVGIPAQDFDWRPSVSGQCVITGTGTDVRVDMIARLSTVGISNGETAGNIVGRAFGIAGQNPPTHILSSGPPAGSGDTYDKVLQGNAATVYCRVERQSGIETFTTSNATTTFEVRVNPVP